MVIIAADILPSASWPYFWFVVIGILTVALNAVITAMINTRFANNLERDKHLWGIEAKKSDLVFQKTAEVVATTYEKILSLSNAAEAYDKSTEPSLLDKEQAAGKSAEMFDKLTKALDEFNVYYEPKKIYLPPNTALAVQELAKAVADTMAHTFIIFTLKDIVSGSSEALTRIEELKKKAVAIKESIPKLLRAMEREFQDLFGFPANEDKPAKVKRWWQFIK